MDLSKGYKYSSQATSIYATRSAANFVIHFALTIHEHDSHKDGVRVTIEVLPRVDVSYLKSARMMVITSRYKFRGLLLGRTAGLGITRSGFSEEIGNVITSHRAQIAHTQRSFCFSSLQFFDWPGCCHFNAKDGGSG